MSKETINTEEVKEALLGKKVTDVDYDHKTLNLVIHLDADKVLVIQTQVFALGDKNG